MLLIAQPVYAWKAFLPWDPWGDAEIYTRALFPDSRGNIVVAAFRSRRDVFSEIVAASVARRDGTIRWSYGDGGESTLFDAAIDAVGNVVLAGSSQHSDAQSLLTVIKLDRDTGAVLWQPDLGMGAALSVAVDTHGDIVVYASRHDSRLSGSTAYRRTLLKLSGVDGRLLWETPRDLGPGVYWDLVLDAKSNLVLHDSRRVSKYRGRDGAEMWSRTVWEGPPAVGGVAVIAIAGGDFMTQDCRRNASAGVFEAQLVLRNGDDGAERWRTTYLEGPHAYCYCQVRVHSHRDIFVASLPGSESESHPLVVRLDAATGMERWRWSGPPIGPLLPVDLAVGNYDDVVVYVSRQITKLSARTGEITSQATTPEIQRRGRVTISKKGIVVVAGQADDEELGSGFSVIALPRGRRVAKRVQPAR